MQSNGREGKRAHLENEGITFHGWGMLSLPFAILKDCRIAVSNPGCNFQGSDCTGSYFEGGLEKANFSSAFLDNCEFKPGTSVVGANFEEASLKEVKLIGVNCADAQFKRAKLKGAKLYQCNFHRANLSLADLRNVTIQSPTLESLPEPQPGAKLSTPHGFMDRPVDETPTRKGFLGGGGWCPDDWDTLPSSYAQYQDELSRRHPDGYQFEISVSFYEADLRGSDLTDSILPWAGFSKASLQGTCLQSVQLYNADFFYARLDGADLRGANLALATFYNAQCHYSDFRTAVLGNEDNIGETGFQGASLQNADFRGARFNLRYDTAKWAINSKTDMTGVNLEGNDLRCAYWPEVKLSRADLKRADLSYGRLTEAKLDEANLSGCRLRETNLAGADLSKTNASEADFTGAVLDAATFAGANLARAIFDGATTLNQTDFRNTDLRQVPTLTREKLENAITDETTLVWWNSE